MADGGMIALLVASTAMSAASAVQQGRNAKAQAEFQAAQYKEQQDIAKIQALDEEVEASRRFDRAQEAAIVSRAAAGLGSDGKSFEAFMRDQTNQFTKELANIRLMSRTTMRKFDLAIGQEKAGGKAAMQAGYAGAMKSVLSGAQAYGNAYGFGGKAASSTANKTFYQDGVAKHTGNNGMFGSI